MCSHMLPPKRVIQIWLYVKNSGPSKWRALMQNTYMHTKCQWLLLEKVLEVLELGWVKNMKMTCDATRKYTQYSTITATNGERQMQVLHLIIQAFPSPPPPPPKGLKLLVIKISNRMKNFNGLWAQMLLQHSVPKDLSPELIVIIIVRNWFFFWWSFLTLQVV